MSFRSLSILLACCLVGAAFSTLDVVRTNAQNPPAPAAEAPAAEAPAAAADVFKVPAGNDLTVLEPFLRNLLNAVPVEGGPDEFIKYFNRAHVSLGEVMKKEIPEDLAVHLAQARLEMMFMRNLLGVEEAKTEYTATVAELQKSDKPAIAKRAQQVDLQLRITYLDRYSPEEREQLFNETAELVKQAKGDAPDELGSALVAMMDLSEGFERMQSEKAADGYRFLLDQIETRKDPRLESLATVLKPRLNRLELVGKPVNFESKTLDGKRFELEQLKGKVVLVDFWATWCGYCIEEFPHIRELYDAYHDKGFEVVAISLDQDREPLTQFLEKNKLPWIQLYDDEGPKGFDSRIVERFGIFATPTTWLIDKDGKMVQLYAHGPSLDKELERLLGPKPEVEAPEIPAIPEVPQAPQATP